MGNKLRFSAAVWCVLVLIQTGSVSAATRSFQLEDLKRIVSLRDARIAPDGKQVAVIVSTPDWKTDKALQEIDIVDVASGARRMVTWKRTGISSPKWSEDGTRLAFLAEDSAPTGDAKAPRMVRRSLPGPLGAGGRPRA